VHFLVDLAKAGAFTGAGGVEVITHPEEVNLFLGLDAVTHLVEEVLPRTVGVVGTIAVYVPEEYYLEWLIY
jgi:hypothetical protein